MCKKILYQILVLSLLGMTSNNEVLAERHTTKGHEQRVERQLLSSEQLLEDLAFIKRSIASVHPEPIYSELASSQSTFLENLKRVFVDLWIAMRLGDISLN